MSEHSVPISENSDIASDLSCDFNDNLWDRIENSTNYKPGGYHPLEIGDELHNGRYRIIHRLGHGGYSTVWLALDRHHKGITPPDARKPRYVAVKIASAKKQTNEAATLRQLQDQLVPCKPEEYPLFVRLLDEFEIHGPNGLHHCLVTELLGPSIRAAKGCIAIEGSCHLLPVSVGRRAAVQCAKALASLHSQGIVHGDLHTGNMAFALTVDIQSWTVEEVYTALGGEPIKVPIGNALQWALEGYGSLTPVLGPTDPHHQPNYLVCTPSVSRLWDLCSSSGKPPYIRIFDFTESFRVPFTPDLHQIPGTPMEFAAPELLLRMPSEVTMAIDIWALGCTIYQLLGEGAVFYKHTLFGMVPSVLGQIFLLLGGKEGVPERFWETFCDELGGVKAMDKLLEGGQLRDWDEKMLYLRGDLPEEGGAIPLGKDDVAVLRRVLNAALVIEPADRAEASAIVAMMPKGWETMTVE